MSSTKPAPPCWVGRISNHPDCYSLTLQGTIPSLHFETEAGPWLTSPSWWLTSWRACSPKPSNLSTFSRKLARRLSLLATRLTAFTVGEASEGVPSLSRSRLNEKMYVRCLKIGTGRPLVNSPSTGLISSATTKSEISAKTSPSSPCRPRREKGSKTCWRSPSAWPSVSSKTV